MYARVKGVLSVNLKKNCNTWISSKIFSHTLKNNINLNIRHKSLEIDKNNIWIIIKIPMITDFRNRLTEHKLIKSLERTVICKRCFQEVIYLHQI